MRTTWVWVFVACAAVVATAERGSSLRGALEALQRRQRSRLRTQPPPDYDALYEFVPPQAYPEVDYGEDMEDMDEEPAPEYIVKLLGNERPSKAYEYQVMKKNSAFNGPSIKQESPFRERIQHSDNDRLRDLFMDRNEAEENNNALENKEENDAEYALLLSQLWSKYKNNKDRTNNADSAPQGVVKLYKEKIVKKRYPNNWGPIAFKRKRSSEPDLDRSILTDTEAIKKPVENLNPIDPNNSYEIPEDDRDEMREEYAIAFQPLDDDSLSDLADEDQYAYESIEKRFPVSKRSSAPYNFNSQKKRFAPDQGQHDNSKLFRSSAGTDPKIINDLSKIFGDADNDIIKSPVKRSSEYVEGSHDTKPPTLITESHNHTQNHNNETHHNDHSHEQHTHSMHPPVISSKDHEQIHHDHENENRDHSGDHKHGDDHSNTDVEHNSESEKPIKIKKKSIDWSDYFGIDKRLHKSVSFVNNLNEDRLKKQYFDTFNKEVIYPINSFRKHNFVKRNYVQTNKESNLQSNDVHSPEIRDEKRSTGTDNDSKLDIIDKKLRNMEGLIVDEALHYSNVGEELDSKEEQEMKEKLLSRLAAAYSLEKMRKALKDFKQSLQLQRASPAMHSSPNEADAKDKRVAVKKERVILGNVVPKNNHVKNEDFEDEQGAGHYLNGKTEEQLSEGYMGGSGRHRIPVMKGMNVSPATPCPALAKIMERCRGVDTLAGDQGQLFLPLCSLHQICYLCAQGPPTTCDLVFLSEADSACGRDTICQRVARSALMALRELHDNLADELDGECEANSCIADTWRVNLGWRRAFQR